MVTAGFDMVFVGIETPNAASLAECRKNQNLKVNLYDQVKKIQQAGIEVTGGFIVGFDKDTEDIFDRQIEFIQKAGIPMAMVGLLGALPNTALYRRLKSEGRLKLDRIWNGNNTHDLGMSFTPVLPEETLIRGYKKIISKIYSPESYFERCLTCIDNLSSCPVKHSTSVSLLDIYSLLLSLLKQTFSRYGFYYLRFLLKVIIHRGRFFHLAVSFSVKGYHFFKMTDDIIKADDYSIQLSKAKSFLEERLSYILAKADTIQSLDSAKIKRQLIHLRKSLQKKYWHLSRDVRVYLYEQFKESEAIFKLAISQIK